MSFVTVPYSLDSIKSVIPSNSRSIARSILVFCWYHDVFLSGRSYLTKNGILPLEEAVTVIQVVAPLAVL